MELMEEEKEQEQVKWHKRSPYLEALIGIGVIILASIAELVHVWVSFPGSIVTMGDFIHAVIDSLAYVLQFDLKLWWVFLLILYIISRRKSIN